MASRVVSGARWNLYSIVASTEVVSCGVLSTLNGSARRGEITSAGIPPKPDQVRLPPGLRPTSV